MIGAETTICVVAVLLFTLPVSFESLTTIEMVRVSVLVLVVEYVIDCKAVWYWAGVALPVRGQHAAGVTAGDPVLVGEMERIARLGVAVQIVTMAPVTSVSNDDTVTAESTVTVWPAVSFFVAWFAVTTGAAIATLTVSVPVLLVVGEEVLSSAITLMLRVPLTMLLVENVTDCKAAVYWAGVALPDKVKQASRVDAADAVLVGEVERIARLIGTGGDLHRGAGDIGVRGRDHDARVDRHGRTAEREGLSGVARGRHGRRSSRGGRDTGIHVNGNEIVSRRRALHPLRVVIELDFIARVERHGRGDRP